MKTIFVFGSNLAGVHGAGAALEAVKNHGAVMGKGIGMQGTSYAIPTKDANLNQLPLDQVAKHVKNFLEIATKFSDFNFKVTQIGCGLAGFSKDEIAPLFRNAPKNCSFDRAWVEFLGGDFIYWGSFEEKYQPPRT